MSPAGFKSALKTPLLFTVLLIMTSSPCLRFVISLIDIRHVNLGVAVVVVIVASEVAQNVLTSALLSYQI